jgi:macrolide-specific efflux system membrane fusion protein
VSPRNVKIGLNNKLTAEVLQGLKEGEQVVTGKVSADAGGSQSQMGGPPVGF